MEQQVTTSASASAAPHVTWDEETIAAHDLLRGTRQKIEEPNTPYHYYGSDHEDDDASSAGELGAVSPARSASGREHEPKLEVRAVLACNSICICLSTACGCVYIYQACGVYCTGVVGSRACLTVGCVAKSQWGELQTKLQRVQDTKQQHHASEWDSSDDEGSVGSKRSHFADRDEEGKKIVKDPKFADKRKSHYNEFERVKAWRQAHASGEDEDEDEDEEKEETTMHD
jgi:protein phosphatase inhibitor 2